MVELVTAVEPHEIECVRALFREYSDQLHFVQCFQDFGNELADLPGAYGPPSGSLLLAGNDTEPVGCVALRKLGDGACEMKRLYVRPAYRGQSIGRLLVDRILADARALGYQRMRLDTLESMHEARAMYERLGFQPIEPYRQYPVSGVLFMELELTSGAPCSQ